jgi:YVTN family beta-propeller protein
LGPGVSLSPRTANYVTNSNSANVSVIDTTTNPPSVTATVKVVEPFGVGIIPDVPFLTFNAHLQIQFGSKPNLDAFGLGSGFM